MATMPMKVSESFETTARRSMSESNSAERWGDLLYEDLRVSLLLDRLDYLDGVATSEEP